MRVFGVDAIEEPGLESRSHGFDVESVGQIAVLAELDQLRLEAGVGLGISRLQNEIAGMRRGRCGGGGPTVSVRGGEIANRLASDEVGDELPFLDKGDALGFHALVVESVVAK